MYQVKAGSLLIVERSLKTALALYDDLKGSFDDVVIRDMDGVPVDADKARRILNEGKPS